MKQFRKRIGRCVVSFAAILLAANFLYPITLGGVVWGGKVEDGRYFVVAKGHRYTEVSEAQWRLGQYVECAFPWLPVLLIWIGLALCVAPDKDEKPTPLLSTKNALGVVSIAFGAVAGTGVLAVVRCYSTGVSWTIGLGVWLTLWIGFLILIWVDSRPTRLRSNDEQPQAPSDRNET